jgi:hypothetical protein
MFMRHSLSLPLLVCCSVLAWQSHLVWGTEASELPPRLQGMKLQGMGTRTILGLHIYQAGLYLDQSDQDAERIIARDVPMAIRLVIVSKLITKERMRRYIQEGFEKATGGHMESLAPRIKQAMAAFHEDVNKGDVFDFIYTPGKGVQIYKNKRPIATMPGLDFKQALFAIWLGPDPIQESLRDALLGKRS